MDLADLFMLPIQFMKACILNLGFGLPSFSLYELFWGVIAIGVVMEIFYIATGGGK